MAFRPSPRSLYVAAGFALVTRMDSGQLLRDAAHAPAGTAIEARLSKGRLRATVTEQILADDE